MVAHRRRTAGRAAGEGAHRGRNVARESGRRHRRRARHRPRRRARARRQGAKVVVNDYGVERRRARADERAGRSTSWRRSRRRAARRSRTPTSVADWDGAGAHHRARRVERFGRIDILVTCAGILRDRMIFNMSEEEWDAVARRAPEGHLQLRPPRRAAHARAALRPHHHLHLGLRPLRQPRAGELRRGQGGDQRPHQGGRRATSASTASPSTRICPVAATRMTADARGAAGARDPQAAGHRARGSALRQLENLEPEDVAPMVVFLASDYAANVNGQFFLCAGTLDRAGVAAAADADDLQGGALDARRAGRAGAGDAWPRA